jgi:hypothetical protein
MKASPCAVLLASVLAVNFVVASGQAPERQTPGQARPVDLILPSLCPDDLSMLTRQAVEHQIASTQRAGAKVVVVNPGIEGPWAPMADGVQITVIPEVEYQKSAKDNANTYYFTDFTLSLGSLEFIVRKGTASSYEGKVYSVGRVKGKWVLYEIGRTSGR